MTATTAPDLTALEEDWLVRKGRSLRAIELDECRQAGVEPPLGTAPYDDLGARDRARYARIAGRFAQEYGAIW